MLENKERARNVSEQTDIIVNMGKFIEKNSKRMCDSYETHTAKINLNISP